MSGHVLGPTGATRDLWVHLDGPGRPRYGRWVTPAGHDVRREVARRGVSHLDVEVWWAQAHDSRGTRLRDMLWRTDGGGGSLMSDRMVALLRDHGAELTAWPADIRWRDGSPVTAYQLVLEPLGDADAAVHSLYPDRRVGRVVVTDEIAEALRAARFEGLEVESAVEAFPGPTELPGVHWPDEPRAGG